MPMKPELFLSQSVNCWYAIVKLLKLHHQEVHERINQLWLIDTWNDDCNEEIFFLNADIEWEIKID